MLQLHLIGQELITTPMLSYLILGAVLSLTMQSQPKTSMPCLCKSERSDKYKTSECNLHSEPASNSSVIDG